MESSINATLIDKKGIAEGAGMLEWAFVVGYPLVLIVLYSSWSEFDGIMCDTAFRFGRLTASNDSNLLA
jgi:hypothetical protein